MPDDLRARIEDAIRRNSLATDLEDDDGELIILPVDNVVAAVMEVVEEIRFRSMHWQDGKCRWCRVIVSEVLAKGLGKQLQPHRMTCRFYVGPVEHHKTGGHQMLTHWATHCTCGNSWDAEQSDECPNSAEVWRAPTPEGAP